MSIQLTSTCSQSDFISLTFLSSSFQQSTRLCVKLSVFKAKILISTGVNGIAYLPALISTPAVEINAFDNSALAVTLISVREKSQGSNVLLPSPLQFGVNLC